MPVIARKIFSSNVLVAQVYILIEPMTDENSPKFYKGQITTSPKVKTKKKKKPELNFPNTGLFDRAKFK